MDLLNLWKLKKYRCQHDAPIVIMKTSFQKERFAKFKKKTETTLNAPSRLNVRFCPNGSKFPTNRPINRESSIFITKSN